MVITLNLIGVLLLIALNGYFVAAEFALVGVRRARIEPLAQSGDRRARRLLTILDNLNAYLSASQLGITLASLALGSIGEPFFSHLLEAPLTRLGVPESAVHIIGYVTALTVITCLHIVIGEQAPKLLGLERAERVALWCARSLQIFYTLFKIPIKILDRASAKVIRLIGLNPDAGGHGSSSYTLQELRQLVDLSHKSGHIESDNQELITRVFDFSEAEVREAMIPRTGVVALALNATLDDTRRAFLESGFSRLPVYRERLDDAVGVLFMKDIMAFLVCGSGEGGQAIDGARPSADFDLESLLHPPLFVPATARLGPVLAQMQASQTHLAFVVDEHGGIEGIVTLEDLLEEIVGDINDEYDDEVRGQIEQEPDGSYLIDASLAIRDANRRFDLSLPEDSDYTTIAGFLLERAGRLLDAGDTIEHDGARFTVESVDNRRIVSVRFTPSPTASEVVPEAAATTRNAATG